MFPNLFLLFTLMFPIVYPEFSYLFGIVELRIDAYRTLEIDVRWLGWKIVSAARIPPTPNPMSRASQLILGLSRALGFLVISLGLSLGF